MVLVACKPGRCNQAAHTVTHNKSWQAMVSVVFDYDAQVVDVFIKGGYVGPGSTGFSMAPMVIGKDGYAGSIKFLDDACIST